MQGEEHETLFARTYPSQHSCCPARRAAVLLPFSGDETMNDELKDLLKRVRYAKEILGMGGYDHAYKANKVLEVVADKLRYLCKITEDDKGEEA
jgi:hypothetical protein